MYIAYPKDMNVIVHYSTFENNHAGDGGAIYFDAEEATLVLTRCVLFINRVLRGAQSTTLGV